MLPLLLAVGGGLLGGLKNRAEQKAQQANLMGNAEVMRWSPWTGMKAQFQQARPNNFLADVAGGALMGAQFGQQFGGAGGGAAPGAPTDVLPTGPAETFGINWTKPKPHLLSSPWSVMGRSYDRRSV